jgi:hypothetical protein
MKQNVTNYAKHNPYAVKLWLSYDKLRDLIPEQWRFNPDTTRTYRADECSTSNWRLAAEAMRGFSGQRCGSGAIVDSLIEAEKRNMVLRGLA